MTGKSYEEITMFMVEHNIVVPMTVIVGVVSYLCIGILYFFLTRKNISNFIKNSSWCLLVGYVFLAFCATIFFRNETPEIRYSLSPLKTYRMCYHKMMVENIMNIFFFVPIGFLIGEIIKKKNTLFVIGVGCLLSMSIEIIQFISRRGVCNIDDVINNTLGCAIGYGIFRLCNSILRIKENNKL